MGPLADIIIGMTRWKHWSRLGWLEIKRRYRRTTIGPFWTAITILIFVLVMGSVGSGLLSKDMNEYIPFLVSGMVVWTMLSSMLVESGNVFVAGTGLIRQMKFEYSVLIYALVWRNFIVFLHNLIVYFAFMLIYKPEGLNINFFLALPGLALLMINGVWLALLIGVLSTRFRDVQQFVQSIVQIAMFVTPLFWPPDSISGTRRVFFVDFNPAYHLLAITREPLLGRIPSLESYLVVIAMTLVGLAIAVLIYSKFRKRLPYWL
jgi:ABC-type polysaccharide/polyol phosphate export permease